MLAIILSIIAIIIWIILPIVIETNSEKKCMENDDEETHI